MNREMPASAQPLHYVQTESLYQCGRYRLSIKSWLEGADNRRAFSTELDGPLGILYTEVHPERVHVSIGASYRSRPEVPTEAQLLEFTALLTRLIVDETGIFPWDEIATYDQPQPDVADLELVAEIPRWERIPDVALAYFGDALVDLGAKLRRARENDARAVQAAEYEKISRKLFARLPAGAVVVAFQPCVRVGVLRDMKVGKTRRSIEIVVGAPAGAGTTFSVDLDKKAREQFRLLDEEAGKRIPRDQVSNHELLTFIAANRHLKEEFAEMSW